MSIDQILSNALKVSTESVAEKNKSPGELLAATLASLDFSDAEKTKASMEAAETAMAEYKKSMEAEEEANKTEKLTATLAGLDFSDPEKAKASLEAAEAAISELKKTVAPTEEAADKTTDEVSTESAEEEVPATEAKTETETEEVASTESTDDTATPEADAKAEETAEAVSTESAETEAEPKAGATEETPATESVDAEQAASAEATTEETPAAEAETDAKLEVDAGTEETAKTEEPASEEAVSTESTEATQEPVAEETPATESAEAKTPAVEAKTEEVPSAAGTKELSAEPEAKTEEASQEEAPAKTEETASTESAEAETPAEETASTEAAPAEDNVTPITDATDVDLEEEIVSLEDIDDITGLLQAEEELISVTSAVDITTKTVAALEAIEANVTEAHENGGLDAQSAALLNVSVSAVLAPFGGQTVKPMPSMESFEGDGGRATATSFALEGVKETLKVLWENLLKMLAKAKEAVMNWISEKSKQMARIEKAAEAIADKANKSEGTPKAKELKVNTKFLAVGDKMVGLDAGYISKDLLSLGKENQERLADVFAAGMDYGTEIISLDFSNREKTEKSLDKATAAIEKFNKAMTSKMTSLGSGDKNVMAGNDDEVVYKNKTPIPGATEYYIVAKDLKTPGETRLVMTGEDKEVMVAALSAEDAGKLAAAIATTASIMSNTQKSLGDIKKSSETLQKAAKAMLKASGELSATDAARAKKIANGIMALSRSGNTALSSNVRMMGNVLNASLSFAKASLSNLEKAKEKKDEKAA